MKTFQAPDNTVEKTKESRQERLERVFKATVDLIEKNKDVDLAFYGIGDVDGVPHGGKGRHGYKYDKENKKVSLAADHEFGWLDPVLEYADKKVVPNYEKRIIDSSYKADKENIFHCVGFKENTLGNEKSLVFAEDRGGCCFSAVIRFNIKDSGSHFSEQDRSKIAGINELLGGDREAFIKLMEGLCLRYVPVYYKELQRLEKLQNPIK